MADSAGATVDGQVTILATSSSFTAEDLCGPPANSFGFRDPGQTNVAVVRDLPPQSTVYYCFDTVTSSLNPYSFTTPPLPASDESRPTVLAAFGDLGRGTRDQSDLWHEYGSPAVNTSILLSREADHGSIDAVFHIGDISYAVGYAASWVRVALPDRQHLHAWTHPPLFSNVTMARPPACLLALPARFAFGRTFTWT